jgi:protein-arginine kinase activator protein McsA|tara:strand:- start:608 stop:886 length:279 start_codon:yes stop_codon:yes gene_type:complete
MTNKQIDKLAELIADKLIAKQKEYDEQFHIDLQETISEKLGKVEYVSKEELLLAELARLMTLLSSYEKSEQYEKAAIIAGKINNIKEKLNNL